MNYKYLKVFVIVLLLSTGCKKGLDLIPKDSISDATFWKTAADFKLAANNLYFSLEGFNPGDTYSDIAYDVPNSVSNGTYQSAENDSRWTNAYVYIRRCNKIIEKAAASPIAAELKVLAAEARFFRAYNYWMLYKLFGEVPLIASELDIDDEALYAPRATRRETVDFILNDLTEAAADLPEQKALSGGDIGRITRGAAQALKARVALFEGTWEKARGAGNANTYLDIAIDAATTVMNSAQYTLYTGKGAQSYRYLFIDEGDNAPECILDRRYEVNISSQTFPSTVGEGHLLPTKKLADMYLCADGLPITRSALFQGYDQTGSEFQMRDPRMTMTIVIPGTGVQQLWYPEPVASWPFYPQRNANTGYTTYKFLSEDAASNKSPFTLGYGYDRHMLRYAEVLLVYAEARFERNDAISDEDLAKSVNLIRQRAGMPALTNAFVGANGLNMREEIRRERTIELALEGFRYDDLRRWKTAEQELPTAIKGIKIVGTPWANPIVVEGQDRNPYSDDSWQKRTDANGFIIVESAAGRVFDPQKHYLLPLPTKEILINPKLTQNPGW
ncbi:RagB/SusD family nutrient uptake outer membrane protein [Niabella drilacis]|uniref:Starch-binding associating with outer membrane n=1 Tax=Niabella drilacis (strain DSM 25811 / CCM 8410 / CCUG 62505 / LMG 26954 / E90) TaxID=1285928 RepID=A0A1G6MT36_NIADE|nr:RagB/SusD family nutrient uptake outer membrane protein [Niabella drilacis]SDC58404.1 Starch-binding associating with outer membrane [Niabella drilacis]